MELTLGRNDVRGLRDQVEPELVEPLLGLVDVGAVAAADFERRLLALEDLLSQFDRLLARQERGVLWANLQYCCSIDRTSAMTWVLNRCASISAAVGAMMHSPSGAPPS